MSLPIFITQDKNFSMMQTQWAASINPVIESPINQGFILKNVPLISGTTFVNHKLGRNIQGWFLVRLRASATVYDTQDSNPTPTLNLSLVSNNAVNVDLYVF